MKKHIPNLLTCANLSCGFLGILVAFRVGFEWILIASILTFIASVFDFLDGLSARLLNRFSEFGKQLDSLADMVTFGVLPGVIIYRLFQNSNFDGLPVELSYISILLPVFSALRLAKFNLESNTTLGFVGLPTPASAILISSLPFIIKYDHYGIGQFLLNPIVLSIVVLVVCFLMISSISMFNLKMTSLKLTENKVRYLFLFCSALLLLFFHFAGIPFVITLYVLISIFIKETP